MAQVNQLQEKLVAAEQALQEAVQVLEFQQEKFRDAIHLLVSDLDQEQHYLQTQVHQMQ